MITIFYVLYIIYLVPYINLTIEEQFSNWNEGAYNALVCTVEAYSIQNYNWSIKWTKNGTELFSSSRVKIVKLNSTTSTVNFTTLNSHEDSSIYKCSVDNYGTDEEYFQNISTFALINVNVKSML